MSSHRIPPIAEPSTTHESLRQTTLGLKEAVEVLSGQRGSLANSAVTWQDLVDLGIITAGQVPKK